MVAETIKRWIYEGQVLWTPGKGDPPTDQRPFTIGAVEEDRIVFDFPRSQVSVRFDEIAYAIRETEKAGGMVRLGAREGWAEPGTFQRFLQEAKGNQQRTVTYVAPVLVECVIAEYTMEGDAKGLRLFT